MAANGLFCWIAGLGFPPPKGYPAVPFCRITNRFDMGNSILSIDMRRRWCYNNWRANGSYIIWRIKSKRGAEYAAGGRDRYGQAA